VAATDYFERSFDIHRYDSLSSLESAIARINPSIICFEFDFPTKTGLKLMQRTKQAHARLPILMLTVQHSESLAVWAFRSKVWDYLVKPISRNEVERCIIGLLEMLQAQALQTETRELMSIKALIPEENRANGSRGSDALQLALAVELVEKGFRDKISSSEVAAQCGLTPFKFSRMFRETYGLTFQEYVLRFRIREACRLLKNPVSEISEVALLTGFNDPSYFGKVFRRYLSCSPSEYQSANDASGDVGLLEELTGGLMQSRTEN
jgi:YesN/AraC family two-component response regulator